MFDENLIATLEISLRKTREAQHRLMSRLREVDLEGERLKQEIEALENSASQTESAIDSLLVTMRSGNQRPGIASGSRIEMDYDPVSTARRTPRSKPAKQNSSSPNYSGGSVTFINQNHGVPMKGLNIEPISHRFSDRTITQSCTLLLRESGKPLHVNELYNLLVAGGMEFKGNNPTISIAVSLNRNRRFNRVGPGTFDLVMREAQKRAS
ncbi:MAG: hypothetical protein WBD22_12645 [Pyrinomonadaceae bacterium]